MLFTTDDYLRRKPDVARRFLLASIRGWSHCVQHADDALESVLRSNPSLRRDEQRLQLREVNRLVSAGAARTEGIGAMRREYYATAERVLRVSGQLSAPVDLDTVFDATLLRSVPAEVRRVGPP
jgi:NitT/TauT family transport system substrate-binding protein